MSMQTINQGGFLAGKKTYILALLAIVTSIMKYLTGDATLVEVVRQVMADPIVIGSGFAATFRDALAGRDKLLTQADDLFGVDPGDDGGL